MRNGNARLSTCSVRASTSDTKIIEHTLLTSKDVFSMHPETII